MDAVECARHRSSTSNKRGTNIGKGLNNGDGSGRSKPFYGYPLLSHLTRRTTTSPSLWLYAELAAITALLEWEINGASACMCAFDLCTVVYVSGGLGYQDHHLPIDIEMLQRWRDLSVDPETSDTHLEQQSTHRAGIGGVRWSRRRKKKKRREGTFIAPAFFFSSFSFKEDSSTLSLTLLHLSSLPFLPHVAEREAATVLPP